MTPSQAEYHRLQKLLKQKQNEEYYPLKFAYENFTSQVTAQTVPESLPSLKKFVHDDLAGDQHIRWYDTAQKQAALARGNFEISHAFGGYLKLRNTQTFAVAREHIRETQLRGLILLANNILALRKKINASFPEVDDAGHAKAVEVWETIATTYQNVLRHLQQARAAKH
ncbi:uncharacterized protein DNG_04171 [Cephalotrichum gorgonifer]|uniref:Uncharacterized protein n=1 Tax=Cephalotrichum gorgonifer TaxID=2041049 RepID=A0AAE8SUN0_9PEZI|nr:uncharacterized protein DNG_04171 [Cephalotrichum gorgonifer]